MKKSLFSLMILLHVSFFSLLHGQEGDKYKVITFAFYNVENLFDTINQEDVNDEEFTPEGFNKWNGQRYKVKLKQLSEVITNIGTDIDPQPPFIIGLCEVENKSVLEDLVNTPLMKPYQYGIIHYDGPYKRGVDVALLYRKELFTILDSKSFTLTIKDMPDFNTRDQLLVSGVYENQVFHIIVNHWPSRRGGEKRSAPLRNAAGDLCRTIVDSLLEADSLANIVIMGDFNDDPSNKSIQKHLKATGNTDLLSQGYLFNGMSKLYKNGIGSLAYRDSWNLFDQIIVSKNLVDKDKNEFRYYMAGVYNKKFLTQKEGPYEGYPFRTFAGGSYAGGYSDHFPVFIHLIKQK